jgi:hypothetical protein
MEDCARSACGLNTSATDRSSLTVEEGIVPLYPCSKCREEGNFRVQVEAPVITEAAQLTLRGCLKDGKVFEIPIQVVTVHIDCQPRS